MSRVCIYGSRMAVHTTRGSRRVCARGGGSVWFLLVGAGSCRIAFGPGGPDGHACMCVPVVRAGFRLRPLAST